MADPSYFKMNTRDYIVFNREPNDVASFFTVGVVQHSGLISGDRTRQICIAPPRETWPRTSAFIGNVMRQRRLFFQSYRRGLSFSTWAISRDSQTGHAKGVSSAKPLSTLGHGPSALLTIFKEI